jgi:hypothetical protein
VCGFLYSIVSQYELTETNQMERQRKRQASKWGKALESVRENITVNLKI